jgi:two-component SAPR family response regulator
MTVLAEVKSAFDLTRARFLSAILLKEQGRAEAAAAWREAGQAILAAGYAFLLEQERELAYPLVAAYLNHPEVAVLAISQWLVEQFQRVPPPLRIVTLGRFEARQGQRRVEQRPLRQRRAGESLALLSLAPGRSLSTEEIIEALWPEREPPAAQTAIHHATSALRHALEPELPDKFPSRYLAAEEGRITLCLPPSSEVDVETMESHYRQGEWEIVLRIYGGDFLPEYSYADWSLAPRERFSILHRQALLAAAQARFDTGRFAEVLEACRRILAAEPW